MKTSAQSDTQAHSVIRRLALGAAIVLLYTVSLSGGLMAFGYRVTHQVVAAEVVEVQRGKAVAAVRVRAVLGDPSSLKVGQTALVVLDGEPASGSVIASEGGSVELSVVWRAEGAPKQARVHLPTSTQNQGAEQDCRDGQLCEKVAAKESGRGTALATH